MFLKSVANDSDCFEIVFSQFKNYLTLADQQAAMANLNDIVCQFEGFKSRDYFYSEADKAWVDFVVWENLEMAKMASEKVMNTPEATKIFSLLDEKKLLFSHYQHFGGASGG